MGKTHRAKSSKDNHSDTATKATEMQNEWTFRVLLCRRLRLPLPLTKHICWCGRRTDIYGHHSAACAQSRALARRGFAVESVVARLCREGGARVATNVMVRDMDPAFPNPADSRRIEVLADGLALFGGVQLAIDTTLVSPLHADGTARPGAAPE